jgi:hypothetical protein
MVRIALAVHLLLVTVAGPWLCCCSGTRLRGLWVPTAQGGPAPEATDRPCCRHHAPEPVPEQAPDEPGPLPSQPSCPCPHDAATHQAALAPQLGDAVQLAAQPLAHAFLASLTPYLDASCSESSGVREDHALPFWTTQDLLHSAHLLRC